MEKFDRQMLYTPETVVDVEAYGFYDSGYVFIRITNIFDDYTSENRLRFWLN